MSPYCIEVEKVRLVDDSCFVRLKRGGRCVLCALTDLLRSRRASMLRAIVDELGRCLRQVMQVERVKSVFFFWKGWV